MRSAMILLFSNRPTWPGRAPIEPKEGTGKEKPPASLGRHPGAHNQNKRALIAAKLRWVLYPSAPKNTIGCANHVVLAGAGPIWPDVCGRTHPSEPQKPDATLRIA